MQLTSEGKRLLVLSGPSWLAWDLSENRLVPLPLAGNFTTASPDGTRFARLVDQTCEVWKATDTEQPSRRLKVVDGKLGEARFSPDGSLLAVRAAERSFGKASMHVWNVGTRDEVANGTFGTCFTWSRDGKKLATTDGLGTLFVFDFALGESLPPIAGRGGEMTTMIGSPVAFSPDGARLLWILDSGTVCVMDLETRKVRTIGKTTPNDFTATAVWFPLVLWSPDGKTIVDARLRTVRLFDSSDAGKVVAELRGHTKPITAVLYSSDGKTLITASEDNTIRFWDAATGRHRGTLLLFGPDQWVALSPEGHYRASPGAEKNLFFVAYPEKGDPEETNVEQFAKKHGWKNDPNKVRLLAP
jgi:WD40 repeat protein